MAHRKRQGVREWVVSDTEAGSRLDIFLVNHDTYSRTAWQQVIDSPDLTVNNHKVKASYRLRPMDYIQVYNLPQLYDDATSLVGAELPPVIYEDKDCLVIDKPAGLIVHPRPGGIEASVAGAVQRIVNDSDLQRPGIVHRLDKDTSGLLMIAKHPEAKAKLQAAFKARSVDKTYLAVVWGQLGRGIQRLSFGLSRGKRPNIVMIDPLGRPSETFIRSLSTNGQVSLIEAKPTTGRTHQIRVHLSGIKHPVVGDKLYGSHREDKELRLLLHAWKLEIPLPSGKIGRFSAPLPVEYIQAMETMECPLPILD